MAAKKPKQRRAKPSKENEEDRVSLQVFKSTNAWWRLIHMPIKILNQQRVDLYSSPACRVNTFIANDLYDNHDDNVCYKVNSYHCIWLNNTTKL